MYDCDRPVPLILMVLAVSSTSTMIWLEPPGLVKIPDHVFSAVQDEDQIRPIPDCVPGLLLDDAQPDNPTKTPLLVIPGPEARAKLTLLVAVALKLILKRVIPVGS